jgi:2-keto-3-deoxy-L-rhamnonate aldolase RhmA
MAAPGLKDMASSRELKLGHFVVEFATPGIGQILKAAGCDFALFDCEHSGFGFETIKSVLRYMHAADLPTIVRVPSKEYHHIARAADMGAEGIMLPMVGSAAEARAILDGMKYHPEGRRGVALAIAHDRYRPGPTLDKLAAANRTTTLFAQIETREGVQNAETIAAIEGVDCLWVGHFDLSASLGIPGQFEHKDFTDAIKAVIKACRKHGKSAGRLVPTVDDGVAFHKGGFDFICYSGDVWALHGVVQQALLEIRARTAPRKGKTGAKGRSKKKK